MATKTSRFRFTILETSDRILLGYINSNTTDIEKYLGETQEIVATYFSSSSTYSVGDYCVYDNKLYKFISNKAVGNWDSSKVQATTVVDELSGSGGITYTLSEDTINKQYVLTGSDGSHSEVNFYKYSKATATADGLMSKEDFSKLADIEAQANKTIVDSALSSTSTNPVENNVIKTALDGITTILGNKVDKVTGKGLSTNDYTTTEKNKLAGFLDATNYALTTDIPPLTVQNGKLCIIYYEEEG